MRKFNFLVFGIFLCSFGYAIGNSGFIEDRSDYNYAPKINNDDPEHPFVIVVCSYNNEKFCIANLESIFSQNYTNFRVIYVNDASTDKTEELVLDYIKRKNFDDKFTYVKNEKNQNAMHNQYHAIHTCSNEEIVVILDGDDRFAHKDVLLRIHQAYCNDDVWGTYGNGEDLEAMAYKNSFLKARQHREVPFLISAPRTFYAGLFKLIPTHRFILTERKYFSNKRLFYCRSFFLDVASDCCIMYNIIDLARDHVKFIDENLYLYTRHDNNDYKVRPLRQTDVAKFLAKEKPLPFYCKEKNDFM